MSTGSKGDTDPQTGGRRQTEAERGLQRLAKSVEWILQNDPGERGVKRWGCRGDLLPAALSLARGGHVAVSTGFYILAAGVIETDGPPGAVVLADALIRLGKDVTVLVDDHAEAIIKAGLNGTAAAVRSLTPGEPLDARRLGLGDMTHLVAVERPGRSRSGRYYNFRGQQIDRFVAPVDDLFVAADRRYTTIGIGDGGNELGLRHVSDRVSRHVENGHTISCRTPADYCICAGVSNWGAYGLTALLSAAAGRCLLPEYPGAVRVLEALVEAGAVDGVSLTATATVDGIGEEWERKVLEDLRELLVRYFGGSAQR